MNQTNNDFFPWDDVPDSNVFPAMTGRFEYSKLEDGESSTGKRMFRAMFTCLEPEQFAGMSHFENFVTGTDENPKAILPSTMGTRSLKSSLTASAIPPQQSAQMVCDLVNAQKPQLMLSLSFNRETKGEYAGREQNRVTSYNKVGERAVQIAPKAGGPVNAPVAPAAPMPQAPTAPAPAPQMQQAAPTPPAPASAPPAAAPAALAPVQAPATPAPTPGPNATPAPPAPAQPAPAVAGPTIPCNNCGQNVPADKFAEHVQIAATTGKCPPV